MTTAPTAPVRPRVLRRIWTALIVIGLVGPWVFGFAVVNGPGFTQSMVPAGPIYLVQAIFLSFVVLVFVVGAVGLVAELVLVRGGPRDLRVWQALGALVCIALAVLTIVGVLVPGLAWAWRN